ncbi:MAG: PEGA domain-containing protein [Myxococcota bacterium]
MSGIGSPKGESGTTPGAEEHGARTAARARAAAVPPAMDLRPEGGAGEWLQQFAWSIEDNNFEWAAYYLKWLQAEGGWAIAQALELAQERLVQAPDGKGSAASLVRLYHFLGPLVPRSHAFHESFLVRLEQRISAMPPGAAAHTVVVAIERALELFRSGLSSYAAFERLGRTLTGLREASEKVIQQERERELENLIASKEFNRAIDLARHLVEKYQSPLASGLLPSLLSRVGPRPVSLETIEGGSSRRLREWDWPEGADETDELRQPRPTHLRMVRSDDEIQLPNKAWSRAFEAPPLPSSGKTERNAFETYLSRGLRRDDPVSLPDPNSYTNENGGQEVERFSQGLVARGELSPPPAGNEGAERAAAAGAGPGEPVVTSPRSTQPGATAPASSPRSTQPGSVVQASSPRSTQPGVVVSPSPRTSEPGVAPSGVASPSAHTSGVAPIGAEVPSEPPSLVPEPLAAAVPSPSPSPVEPEKPFFRRAPVMLGLLILLSVVVYGVIQLMPGRNTVSTEPVASTPTVAQAAGEPAEQVPQAPAEPTFKAPSGPPSLLTLEVQPDDKLELYLNGIIYPDGKVTGLTVPSGKHLIEIYRQGYEPFKQEIFTSPDNETRMQVTLTRSAQLNLEVSPSKGVEVRIDGRVVTARLPLKGYVLPPGKHRVEVLLDGYETYVEEVNATAASTFQLKVTLKPLAP